MKRQSKPDISKEEAIKSHNDSGSCSSTYIISKPIAIIEHTNIFSKRFYSEKCWQCLNCKWESEKVRTRLYNSI